MVSGLISDNVPMCGAKARTGRPCRKPAGWGTAHPGYGKCKMHAGSTPSGQLFGTRLMLQAEGPGMGVPIDIGPHEALLELTRHLSGTVMYLATKLNEFDGSTLVEDGPLGVQANVWVRLHQTYVDKLARVSKMAVDAGVEERMVRQYEEQGMWLSRVVDMMVERLHLTEAQLSSLPTVMGEVIRELEVGQVAPAFPVIDLPGDALIKE